MTKNMNKKLIIWIFSIIVLVVIAFILLPYIKESKSKAEHEAEIQALRETPAAEYCQNSNWRFEIIDNEVSGIYWMCYFEDWSACEILEYFRWECLPSSEETDDLFCSDWSVCNDEENQDLSSWIDDINNTEIIDEEDENNNNEVNTEKLYNYYEDSLNNSKKSEWAEAMGKLKSWADFNDICEWVWWTVLKDRCFLADGIEITF